MATTKPDYTYKWASDGDKIAPSDAKIQTGWSPEIPPYQWENWIQNRQDEMLAHINERGIAEWDNKTDYIAGKSYVQGSDGKVYKSVTASGPTTTVQDPVTDSTDTYWTIAFADVGAFLDQTAGDARYAQRANNLSDLTNAATARTNLGLGSAATKAAQTSFTDTTAGALMAVGAGGWLGASSTDSYIAGFPQSMGDNKSQIYRRGTSDDVVTAYSASIHFAAADTWGRLRIRYNTPGAWIQGGITSDGSGWTAELYHTGNVSSFAKTLLDDADAAAARATLGAAPTVSPAFTGTPTAPTAAGGTNTTQLATTAFVKVAVDAAPMLGVGQAWQDVTGDRAKGTTYTNTTGKPIQILVQYQDSAIGGATFSIGGLSRNSGDLVDGDTPYWFSAVIPNGVTYSISGGVTLPAWWELR